MAAAELAQVIRRRIPNANPTLEADLSACEEAAWGETVNPRQALKLLQILHDREQELIAAQKLRSHDLNFEGIHSKQHERAS
jgi:hypothetical protein